MLSTLLRPCVNESHANEVEYVLEFVSKTVKGQYKNATRIPLDPYILADNTVFQALLGAETILEP